MAKAITDSKTVTTKMGDKFDVEFEYSIERATRHQPQEFEFEIKYIYDEDGWDVTETLDESTKEEIESLAIEGI